MKKDPLKEYKVRKKIEQAERLQMAGNADSAAQIYSDLLADDAALADALYGMGVMALQSGDLAGGESWLDKALIQAPENAWIWNALGEARRLQGRTEQAIEAYQQAIRFKPEFPEAHNNLGVTLAALGENDRAAECFRQAIGLDPTYAHAFNNLGVILEQQGVLDEALKSYEAAVGLQHDFADAMENYTSLLQRHPEMLGGSVTRLVDHLVRD